MRVMTCKQLGGACDLEFRASTFEELAEMSKQHGVEMYQRQDAAHLQAMRQMQDLMRNPKAMQEWYDSKKREFEALPDS
ncbi:DUF1059 domain-containing protein [Microbulbifer epialgicus]|uniref:DUF1059 domain-containing protein n=1 Tax=Microbulbifer epialgicus TaxID=393907 RepID=A0ABV4P4A7_9GAMM